MHLCPKDWHVTELQKVDLKPAHICFQVTKSKFCHPDDTTT